MKTYRTLAHPSMQTEESTVVGGMTILDYFTAKAPKEIPRWFEPEMQTDKPKRMDFMDSVFGKGSGHKHSDLYLAHWNDEENQFEHNPTTQPIPEEFKQEVLGYWKAFQERHDEIKTFDELIQFERLFQWPIFWAKSMLEKLGYAESTSYEKRINADTVTTAIRLIMMKLDAFTDKYKFEILSSDALKELKEEIHSRLQELHDEIDLPF